MLLETMFCDYYFDRWATWTCVLGDDVQGIWEKFTNTDDINAVDVCKENIVTGDDFGKVQWFIGSTLSLLSKKPLFLCLFWCYL